MTLDVFMGPLDLLLYLVRKHELGVTEVPIADVTYQYLQFLDVIEQIDVAAVGDFLEIASTLIELKSRSLFPVEEEIDEPLEDPRQGLVRRLIEFKRFRDAASILDERGRQWRERFARRAIDASDQRASDEQPLQELELWDLVSAFGRVLKARLNPGGLENIRYDETPIHVYMQRIGAKLERAGRTPFTEFFEGTHERPKLVGLFLAVLELVRHRHARVTQPELFGEIWLEAGDTPLPAEIAAVSDYDQRPPAAAA